MCHQTVCLIARHLEENGIPTLIIASALDITRRGRPPRAVFVDYPLGHTTGKPFDRDDQLGILRAALKAFDEIEAPETIRDLGLAWAGDETWKATATDASSGDQRQPRDTTPRYQLEADRLAAEARAGTDNA